MEVTRGGVSRAPWSKWEVPAQREGDRLCRERLFTRLTPCRKPAPQQSPSRSARSAGQAAIRHVVSEENLRECHGYPARYVTILLSSLRRNQCPLCRGISVQFAVEYACKMLPGEKLAVMAIYDAVRHLAVPLFDHAVHDAISAARLQPGPTALDTIHPLRVYAEAAIPKPVMKHYKAFLREGLFG